MPEDFAPQSEIFERARRAAKPLFLGNVWEDGHTVHTVNATVTFVELDGRWTAITCRHAVDGAERRGGGRRQASYVEIAGRKVALEGFGRCPAKDESEEAPDLAARAIGDELRVRLVCDGVEAIGLARASEWPEGDNCEAFGFATNSKFATGPTTEDGTPASVGTLGISACATLTGSPDSNTFRLSASVSGGRPDIDFSGMSGGPIFCVDDVGARLLGIVMRGIDQESSKGLAVSDDHVDVFGQRVSAERLRRALESLAI